MRNIARKQQAGFTMMEVLVAIVIITVGLLGIAGLQALSLRSTAGAGLRTIATQLAYDMTDRMRSNAEGVGVGAYDVNANPASVSSCYTSGCSFQQVAQQDLQTWLTRVQTLLPDGQAIICRDGSDPEGGTSASPGCDNDPKSPYYVKIFWKEVNDETVGAPVVQERSFVTAFLP
jgi:type IV pilus assembly protein PilV